MGHRASINLSKLKAGTTALTAATQLFAFWFGPLADILLELWADSSKKTFRLTRSTSSPQTPLELKYGVAKCRCLGYSQAEPHLTRQLHELRSPYCRIAADVDNQRA